jgi:hypothetical protein
MQRLVGKPSGAARIECKIKEKNEENEVDDELDDVRLAAFPRTIKVKKHFAKAKLSASKSESVMKKPAAAKTKTKAKTMNEKPKPKTKVTANPLAFPGTGKRPPLHYGNSVVYFSPDRFRLMATKGDRVDTAYAYKICSSREAWTALCKELKRLNPKA